MTRREDLGRQNPPCNKFQTPSIVLTRLSPAPTSSTSMTPCFKPGLRPCTVNPLQSMVTAWPGILVNFAWFDLATWTRLGERRNVNTHGCGADVYSELSWGSFARRAKVRRGGFGLVGVDVGADVRDRAGEVREWGEGRAGYKGGVRELGRALEWIVRWHVDQMLVEVINA